MKTHSYIPLPLGIDREWTHALDVYRHLLANRPERERLLREVCNRDPGQPFTVKLYHPLSPWVLRISTVETDEEFQTRIQAWLVHEIRQRAGRPAPIVSHYPTDSILHTHWLPPDIWSAVIRDDHFKFPADVAHRGSHSGYLYRTSGIAGPCTRLLQIR